MSDLTLFIANKNYSSWSFRPWIAMKAKAIAFDEVLTPFDDDAGNPRFAEFSPTKKVPVLRHDGLAIWETLAIMEYLADLFPELHFWPQARQERGLARSAACEMATGFPALRAACPMNMRRAPAAIAMNDGIRADVARIEALWSSFLERSGGPFLCGRSFSALDAMYAPVVNRFEVYALSANTEALSYMETIKALPAWKEWEEAARAEPWIVPADEV